MRLPLQAQRPLKAAPAEAHCRMHCQAGRLSRLFVSAPRFTSYLPRQVVHKLGTKQLQFSIVDRVQQLSGYRSIYCVLTFSGLQLLLHLLVQNVACVHRVRYFPYYTAGAAFTSLCLSASCASHDCCLQAMQLPSIPALMCARCLAAGRSAPMT